MTKHAIIAAVLALVIFKSGVFVFATAVPIFYLFTMYGRKTGLLSLAIVVVTALLAEVFGMADWITVLYLSYFLFVGFILGEGVAKRLDVLRLAGAAIFAPWLVVMVSFVVLQFGLGVPLISNVQAYLSQAMEQVLKMQDAVKTLSAPQMAYVREHLSDITIFMLYTIPAAILLFGMLVVSLTLLLVRSFTRKYHALKYFGNIAIRRFPFWPVWITIACGAVFFADAYLLHNIYLRYVAINGLLCCAGIYFIEGCFVISFWLHKGRSPFLRLVVYGLIIVFLQVVGFIIIALGLSDQWVDFRKRSLGNTTMA